MQFISANQFSPRLSATYKPFENTTFHAGYARYFTPPVLVEAAPANIALFNNTTGAAKAGAGQRPGPAGALELLSMRASIKRSRSDAPRPSPKDCSSLELGVDAYYKIAKDLIDNGQFGQALVFSAFNYAKGWQRRHRIPYQIQ